MEDVLALYAQPADPEHPVVCFDERPVQLHSEVHPPQAVQPGRVRRIDYEYRREGTCNLFMCFQPSAGWRWVKVTERRTKVDFAQCMKALVDEHFPHAKRIRVVLDNLNTHSFASLYAAFEPQEAFRLTQKLEFHYTPKHGSWLNMAEIEFSILARQCLSRRIPSLSQLDTDVSAWTHDRNARSATVRWRFTLSDARARLHWLYCS